MLQMKSFFLSLISLFDFISVIDCFDYHLPASSFRKGNRIAFVGNAVLPFLPFAFVGKAISFAFVGKAISSFMGVSESPSGGHLEYLGILQCGALH